MGGKRTCDHAADFKKRRQHLLTDGRRFQHKQVMNLIALAMLAAPVNASPSMPAVSPEQRDAQCLIALNAEKRLGPLQDVAAAYFGNRVGRISDPELKEFITIAAQEAILPNRNRREIASTCLLLHQVLVLQEQGQGKSAAE